jgi:hypothetical protein
VEILPEVLEGLVKILTEGFYEHATFTAFLPSYEQASNMSQSHYGK